MLTSNSEICLLFSDELASEALYSSWKPFMDGNDNNKVKLVIETQSSNVLSTEKNSWLSFVYHLLQFICFPSSQKTLNAVSQIRLLSYICRLTRRVLLIIREFDWNSYVYSVIDWMKNSSWFVCLKNIYIIYGLESNPWEFLLKQLESTSKLSVSNS